MEGLAAALAAEAEARRPAATFKATADVPTWAKNFLRVNDFVLSLGMIESPLCVKSRYGASWMHRRFYGNVRLTGCATAEHGYHRLQKHLFPTLRSKSDVSLHKFPDHQLLTLEQARPSAEFLPHQG